MDYIIYAILVIWGISTVFLHTRFPKFREFLSIYDIASLVPSWHFFAPQPPAGDYRVVYRARSEGVSPRQSDWFPVSTPARNKFNWIWNPFRRNRKALFDLCVALSEDWRELDDAGYDLKLIQSSLPFLMIANMLPNRVKQNCFDSTHYQFSVLIINELESRYESIFMSPWLKL